MELTKTEASAPHSESEADDLVGREVGGYIVEGRLGEGGMGLVYRARHPILNRHFAVKVLRPEAAADPRISVSFEREAQTLSSLKHPHIIDIVGFGTLADGRQYMVMEFVKGQTLQQELESSGRIDLNRALKLADQILDGLEAAHSVGVIHRDMKPSNVLIARVSGGTEVLKLLDFGLAKQQPEALVGSMVGTAAGASVIAGTPEYIAPEQAQGKHAGKHSDIYSFGVVFFEMLTGFQPFLAEPTEADRIRSLLTMHLHHPAPLISTLVPEGTFPPELEELVADLLKKDPSERPSSAQTVRARLSQVQRALQHESTGISFNPLLAVSALPLGPRSDAAILPLSSRLEPLRRSRAIFPVAAALLLFVALGGGWLTRSSAPAVIIAPPPPTASPEIAPAPPLELPRKREPEAVALTPPPPPGPVAKKVLPRTPSKLTVTIANPSPKLQINSSACEPNERWRAAAKANLQEIQQTAAGMDKAMWAQFENLEPAIIAAISSASTGLECDAVETKLERLARKFKP